MADILDDENVKEAWDAYAEAHFRLRGTSPTELERAGMKAALEAVLPEAWDGGYGAGYSQGYTWAANEIAQWLRDEGHTEASEALAYLLSPEGVAEMNRRLREAYGSLAKLAEEARSD